MEEPRHPRNRVHIKLPKRVCNWRLARWGFVSEGSKLREAGYGGSQCCELPPNLCNSRGEKERDLRVVVFFLFFIILLLLIWAVKSVAEELAKPPKKAGSRPITTPTSPTSIITRLPLQSFKTRTPQNLLAMELHSEPNLLNSKEGNRAMAMKCVLQ